MKNLSWGIQWTTTLNDWEEGRMFYVVRSEMEGISGRGVLATWHWLSREKVVVHPVVLRAVSDFESEWRWWWVHNCVIVGGRVWWLDQVTNQIHLYLHPLTFFLFSNKEVIWLFMRHMHQGIEPILIYFKTPIINQAISKHVCSKKLSSFFLLLSFNIPN